MAIPWAVSLSTSRFFPTRSAILRRQTSPCSATATMSTAGEQNTSDTAHLDTIFKQKKALRLVVKRDLKSMDPTLRSEEGSSFQYT